MQYSSQQNISLKNIKDIPKRIIWKKYQSSQAKIEINKVAHYNLLRVGDLVYHIGTWCSWILPRAAKVLIPSDRGSLLPFLHLRGFLLINCKPFFSYVKPWIQKRKYTLIIKEEKKQKNISVIILSSCFIEWRVESNGPLSGKGSCFKLEKEGRNEHLQSKKGDQCVSHLLKLSNYMGAWMNGCGEYEKDRLVIYSHFWKLFKASLIFFKIPILSYQNEYLSIQTYAST